MGITLLAEVCGCIKNIISKTFEGRVKKSLYIFVTLMNIELIFFRYRVSSCARLSASAGAKGTAIKFLGICLLIHKKYIYLSVIYLIHVMICCDICLIDVNIDVLYEHY